MKHLWITYACVLLGSILIACQPENPVATPLPESTQTPAFTSTPIQENATMVSPATPDPSAEKMVTLAKEHLSRKLGIAVEKISLFDVEPVQWPDGSLGCPRSGMIYTQAVTPGFRISLEATGQVFSYHTDSANQVILCEARPPDEIYPTP